MASSLTRQRALLAVACSSVYYERGHEVDDANFIVMRLLDELHLQ